MVTISFEKLKSWNKFSNLKRDESETDAEGATKILSEKKVRPDKIVEKIEKKKDVRSKTSKK